MRSVGERFFVSTVILEVIGVNKYTILYLHPADRKITLWWCRAEDRGEAACQFIDFTSAMTELMGVNCMAETFIVVAGWLDEEE